MKLDLHDESAGKSDVDRNLCVGVGLRLIKAVLDLDDLHACELIQLGHRRVEFVQRFKGDRPTKQIQHFPSARVVTALQLASKLSARTGALLGTKLIRAPFWRQLVEHLRFPLA